jgi:hypothetical protein
MPTASVMSIPQEPMRDTAGATVERCRSCGARVRPEDEWCTLCLVPVERGLATPAPDEASRAPEPSDPHEPHEPDIASEPVAVGAAAPAAAPLEPGTGRSELAAAARAVVAAHERVAPLDDAGEYDETDDEALARRARDEETESMLAALSATESAPLPPRLARISPDNQAAGAVLALLGGCAVLAVIMAALAVVGRFL